MITIYLKQYNKIVRNADAKLLDELGWDDILWIDMLTPSIKEQKTVESFLEINLQTRQEVQEIESTSKYFETENSIVTNSNFFLPTGETFLVEPVSFIVAEGVLVSVRNAEFRTFTEVAKRLQMNYRAFPTRVSYPDLHSGGSDRLRCRFAGGVGQVSGRIEQTHLGGRKNGSGIFSIRSASCRKKRCCFGKIFSTANGFYLVYCAANGFSTIFTPS
ncbi:MAG: hypothetical protein LUD68_06940 [Rikenellaceae bacterium]|nr:hypothetical protein [Rikenellaceae bacterium]